MSKPKLLPVGVPWSIAPSTPFMRVYRTSGEIPLGMPWMSSISHAFIQTPSFEKALEDLFVTFVAYFGLEDQATNARIPSEKEPAIVKAPVEFEPNVGQNAGAYQMLRLTFHDVADSTVFRSGDDFNIQDIYDCSLLELSGDDVGDWEETRRRYWEKWRQTGLCPDPQMYEIVSSPQLAELRSTISQAQSFRHYLLLGHDMNAEVIAARWRWEMGQPVKGW